MRKERGASEKPNSKVKEAISLLEGGSLVLQIFSLDKHSTDIALIVYVSTNNLVGYDPDANFMKRGVGGPEDSPGLIQYPQSMNKEKATKIFLAENETDAANQGVLFFEAEITSVPR